MRWTEIALVAAVAAVMLGAAGGVAAAHPGPEQASPAGQVVDQPEPGDTPDQGAPDLPEPGDVPDSPGDVDGG